MRLQKLLMVNFRNYERAEIHFHSKISLIYGLNAQGKTNFLEAIYLLCLGRSFRQARNQELLRIGSNEFMIEGQISLDNQISRILALQCVKDGKKEVSVDRKRQSGYAEIFGNFPVVVISPEDYKITTGGPSERRRFVDILLSQISISYLLSLQEYHRVLKQRNRLLQNIKSGHRVAEAAIEPWTEKMIALGNKIVSDRFRLIGELAGLLAPIYREYSGSNDEVRITIESQVQPHHGEEAYWTALKNLKQRERQLGVSLVGPHRDDLNISINDRDLRDYGSRGEHKSVLIALRLAELQFLKQKREETPVFLLDDCFSELDETRERGVFFSFHGLGQMFLTSPRELGFLEEAVSSEISKYRVQNGVIEPL